MSYNEFKAFYGAMLAVFFVVGLGFLTAYNPIITACFFGVFFLIGGIYIVRREGWFGSH